MMNYKDPIFKITISIKTKHQGYFSSIPQTKGNISKRLEEPYHANLSSHCLLSYSVLYLGYLKRKLHYFLKICMISKKSLGSTGNLCLGVLVPLFTCPCIFIDQIVICQEPWWLHFFLPLIAKFVDLFLFY